MITAIINVDSTKSSGKITFDAITNGTANEVVSTSLGGQRFTTNVNGNTNTISGSISHTKTGRYMVVLRAETSNVSSNPLLLDL